MQTNSFTKISILVILLISLYILFYIGEKAAVVVPFPSSVITATTSETLASTTPVVSTTTPVMLDINPDKLPTVEMKAPKGTIHTLIATTDYAQEKGLGDRDSLPDGDGMLFVFQNVGSYDFWMKDMKFPLDMVWISSKKTVLGVTKDISPASYPKTFSPPAPIQYVLELNTGGSEKFGIAAGTKLVF